mgnify:FL=1
MLTAKQVQNDIYQMLRTSTLSSMISGAVYKAGYRPRDSRLEDAIVIFTAGLTAEVETGVVTINLYVPDIDAFDNGVLVEDGARTTELENAAAEWVETLTAEKSNYKFSLNKTIYTEADTDIKQHFVVIVLEYKYLL